MAALNAHLAQAVQHALAGQWEAAHDIAQSYSDPLANWLHAILHKMEGDAANSRYWYARSGGRHYEAVADVEAELQQLLRHLS